MPKIVLALGAIGCGLLFIATAYLVKLNWSGKIITTPAVIFLGAVVTTFISILLLLKESKLEVAFPTSVVFNKNQQLPAMLPFNRENERVSLRMSSLASLGQPFIQKDGKSQLTITRPTSFDETNRFCLELLQYKIFRDIEDIQRRVWSVATSGTTVTGKINMPVRIPEAEIYNQRKLMELSSKNRFSNSEMERFRLETSKLFVPPATTISFKSIPSSPETGSFKQQIVMEKPYFFTIEITVEGMGSVTVPPVFPQGVQIPQDQIQNYQTYMFAVRMTAVFQKWTSENWRTEEYKKWAAWLFTEIQNELSD